MAGAFTHNGNVVEGLPSIASQINYSNTSSGLSGTTAQSAIDELASEKQDKSDNSLQTTDKTIPGAINEVRSGLTNVTRLAHEDYIDVYQVGVTVHIYLRSNGTYTPNDTNTLVSNMPLPKGLLTIFNGMSYYDGASKTGIISIDQSGDIKIMDNGGNPITHVNYLSGELVYLVN